MSLLLLRVEKNSYLKSSGKLLLYHFDAMFLDTFLGVDNFLIKTLYSSIIPYSIFAQK